MSAPLVSLACLPAIALTSYALGRPIVRGFGVGRGDALTSAVWSVAVGLVAAGLTLTGLGLLGLLYAPWIGVGTLLACFGGIGQLVAACDPTRRRVVSNDWPRGPLDHEPDAPWPEPPTWLKRGAMILAALACAGSLVTALAPPTAGDALCYHLELPKAFLADHALGHLPDSENSTYPLLVEMWFLWGLALDGGVAAQLVHWGLGMLLILASVVLATPIVERPWAWIVGAIVALVPGVTNQMTAPLNDVALAAFTTLALAAWWRGTVGGESRRWFVLAGVAGGAALSTKYLAALFAVAVGVAAAWSIVCDRRRCRVIVEGTAVVLTVALSVSGVWYLRAARHRGNPVYPFFSEVLGSDAAGAHETLPESKSPLGRNPVGLATAAWHVTMHPERFGGRGHQLGALFLAAVPGIVLTRRLRGLGMISATALAYCVAWYLLRQNVRFLLPVVPLLAVIVVWVWMEMSRFPRLARWMAGGAFAMILAVGAAVPVLRCRHQLAVAAGFETRDAYLARHEPTWQAAQVCNELFGPGAHLLSQDHRAYHFRCRVTRESVYRRRTRYDERIADPATVAHALAQAGFTHVLLAENLSDRGIQYDPTLSRLVDAQSAAGQCDSLVRLVEYRFADADGALRRYRLLWLRYEP